MKKLLLVAVLAALVLAPAALGKELQSVSVCGPEGCNSSGGDGRRRRPRPSTPSCARSRATPAAPERP